MKLPWRGINPTKLAIRGLVQLAVSGFVIWGCVQVLTGNVDLTEASLAEYESTITTAARVGMVLAAVWALFSLARVLVGVVDLVGPRQVTPGRFAGTRDRTTGDTLPGLVQHLIYRRSDRDLRRQRWIELGLDTVNGSRTWVARPRVVSNLQHGSEVTVYATRILGYVTKVDAEK